MAMTHGEFAKIIERRLYLIDSTMLKKQKEYTRDGSAFHNFEEAGKEFNCTPAESLMGMMAKHYVSLKDILKDLSEMKNGILVLTDSKKIGVDITHDYIEEKIGDLINYLILLEGILKEKTDGEK